MSDIHGQSEAERRLSEAIALAQSIVDENNKKTQQTISPEPDSGHDKITEAAEAGKLPGEKNNKIVWKIVFALSVMALLICGSLIVRYMMGHNRSLRAEKKLKTYVDINSETTTESTDAEVSEDSGRWYPDLKVDFTGLQSQNPDICAWIYIPGTDVDYPVLKGTDNSFYLSHDAYGQYSPDGSIFVDAGCGDGFDDFDTIIYGHNMSTGTMFKTLHNYENDEFWDENRNVYIYLPDRVIRYEVFAAYRTNDRHILTYNDFSDNGVRENYIQNIKDKNFDEGIVKNDQNIDIDSTLLTLSTCCGMDGKRWLVQAVKIDETSTDEDKNPR